MSPQQGTAPVSVRWVGGPDGHLELLDQTRLPGEVAWVECRDVPTVIEAIRSLRVRGAPAIGITAGYGLYLGIHSFRGTPKEFQEKLFEEARYLDSSRPTARNLAYALERILNKVALHRDKHIYHLKKLANESGKFF